MIVQNTAGEMEREKRSRQFNAIEAFSIYTFILVMLWPIAYYFGVLPGNDTIADMAVLPLIAGGIYLLFITPFIHRDSPESWGLGNPARLWRMIREGNKFERTWLPLIILVMFVILNAVVFWRWPDVVGLFGLKRVEFAGMLITEYRSSFPHIVVVFASGALLATLYLTCAVRYDNFVPAFLMALKISLPLAVLIFIGALVSGWQQGTNPFAELEPGKFILDMLGYLFWGFIQQLLFTAYLGNRFRKAFPPSASPTNTLPPEQRLGFSVLFGVLAGIALALLGVWGLKVAYPEQEVPFTTLLLFFLFAAPLWTWYGYILALDRKRLLVSTLAASCFAFIHIASYGLVAATWMLGTILIYLSMEDRYRNLVALGAIHGVLGSTLGQLFSKGNSGSLEIDYSVGPWNIDNPALGTLWFPLLCIVAYIAMMIWSTRHLASKEDMVHKPV